MLNTLAHVLGGIALMVAGWFGHAPASNEPSSSSSEAASVTVATSAATTVSNARASGVAGTKSSALPNGSAWLATLPLGDGKYVTSGPKLGYVYVCHVAQGGQGAQGTPSWISGSIWYPAKKVAVSGSVPWPSATYSMKVSGSTRLITSNGLPTDHNSGTFPIARTDPAYQYDANPNSIKAQSDSFSLPASPSALTTPGCIYGQVGIMTDGVPLFDGFDAEYRDAVAHETQDAWEAHPDEQSEYHYHGFEDGPVKLSVSTVVGFAFDGYPITGSALPNGNYLHTADLDQCHGLTSTITLDGKQVTTYHYVLTQDFPYSVSCFHGKSYEPKPGGSQSTQGQMPAGQGTQSGGTQGSGTPPAPPQEAISACTGKSSGASCTVGPTMGACATIGSYFACKP